MISKLSPGKLKSSFDHKKLNCDSTKELIPLEGIIGQDRAVKALKFGLNIENGGFNIFVSGYSGTGRMTGVKNFVEELQRVNPYRLTGYMSIILKILMSQKLLSYHLEKEMSFQAI